MNNSKTANLFDLLILLIVCISFASVGLLVFNAFHPYSAVVSGILLVGITVKFLSLKVECLSLRIPVVLLVILLVALFFRARPYLYVPGGQDQGLYVNMSAIYEKKGSTFITDEVRKKAVASGLQKYYDTSNQWLIQNVVKGEFEGMHLLGIYIKDLAQSQYVFQFYPLHSLWMALTGKFFGNINRVYSLVFFSLLSIVGFYLLCFEITEGSKNSAALVALFLALNPLHAFFSKFPVTEIVALAFSSLGFFYLTKYYRIASAGELKPFYLILSAGLFECMFFTHISGFTYLPLFYLLLSIAIVFENQKPVQKQLIIYFISIFMLYALSVAYGMNYSYPYSHDIYLISFKHIFSSAWEKKLSIVIIAAILCLPLLWVAKKQLKKLISRIKINFTSIFYIALLGIIIIAFYKSYILAYTDKFVGDESIDKRWHMAGYGWKALPHANIFVAIMYLSPFGFLLFFYDCIRSIPKQKNVLWLTFAAFLAMFWFYRTIIQDTTPYQYYYARYLVSELIPYSLLSISILLGELFTKNNKTKILSITLCGLISIYFGYYTVYQFSGKTADGAHASLSRIQRHLENNDLLLIYPKHFKHLTEIKTALSFFYDVNTFKIKELTDLETILKSDFLNKFKDVFILSREVLEAPLLVPVEEIQYTEGYFAHRKIIPRSFEFIEFPLFLYRVDGS
jgi:hypothetical protein